MASTKQHIVIGAAVVALGDVLKQVIQIQLGTIELWSSPFPQVEIVRASRAGIRAGETLAEINRGFELYRGPVPPAPLMRFLDRELRRSPHQHTFALAEPVSAVFVDFKQWQIG